jgi:hypothetical protein
VVTSRDVETYVRDGVCLRGVFAPRWRDVLAGGAEEDIRTPGPLHTLQQTGGEPGFLPDFRMAQRIPAFRGFLFDSPAAEVAGSVDCEDFPRVWPRSEGPHPARSARFRDPGFQVSV